MDRCYRSKEKGIGANGMTGVVEGATGRDDLGLRFEAEVLVAGNKAEDKDSRHRD